MQNGAFSIMPRHYARREAPKVKAAEQAGRVILQNCTPSTLERFLPVAETFGPALRAPTGTEAAGVTLAVTLKADKDPAPLRAVEVDIEIGVIDAATALESRAFPLFEDRWIAALRADRPGASACTVTRSTSRRSVPASSAGSPPRGPWRGRPISWPWCPNATRKACAEIA